MTKQHKTPKSNNFEHRNDQHAAGPDPIDVHVGTRIRHQRTAQQISQTKLGNALGVSFQQIQKYESGVNRIGASNLYRVSQALGVHISYFFDEMPTSPGDETSNDEQHPFTRINTASPEAAKLLHYFFNIPHTSVRQALLLSTKALANSYTNGAKSP